MKYFWIILALYLGCCLTFRVIATETKMLKGQKIIYKYKKYERFDFEDLVIEGETGSPGDLSVISRYQMKFKNKLPYRKNFNSEIRKSVERIR